MDIHEIALLIESYSRKEGVNLLEAYKKCYEFIPKDSPVFEFQEIKQYLFDYYREQSKNDV